MVLGPGAVRAAQDLKPLDPTGGGRFHGGQPFSTGRDALLGAQLGIHFAKILVKSGENCKNPLCKDPHR